MTMWRTISNYTVPHTHTQNMHNYRRTFDTSSNNKDTPTTFASIYIMDTAPARVNNINTAFPGQDWSLPHAKYQDRKLP